jgi:hypothetical protein
MHVLEVSKAIPPGGILARSVGLFSAKQNLADEAMECN